MEKSTAKDISVFIASPGDLAAERKIFKDTIDKLNAGFGDGAGVKFEALGWEDELAHTGTRPQDLFNQQIQGCDVFILALHRRWGQEAKDSKYSSYTEEEFNLAFSLWQKNKKPKILVFYKNVDNDSVGDAGPQLQKVLEFKKKIEETRLIWPRTFNEGGFGALLDEHLRKVARGEADEQGDGGITFTTDQVKALSQSADATTAKADKADLSMVQARQTEIALARAAVRAANAGESEEARVLFAKATEGTTDPSILAVAAEFFRQIGDPDNASRLVLRQAAIGRDRTIAAQHYLALVPQGFLSGVNEQMVEQMLAGSPAEEAEEIRSINEEVFGGGKLERLTMEMMVKYYTEAELVELARFLASPVGQSSLQKQQAMMAEVLTIGQQEFQRVYLERHPELAELAEQQQDEAASLPSGAALELPARGQRAGTAAFRGGTEKPN
ncbi:MAG TPA: DUF4062 domain-containing protein [Candidatus Bathyarchaeia archaeon]|nr:DUF4062 domain-containing protein [Candidatus Bathyarchaeia archaeon]